VQHLKKEVSSGIDAFKTGLARKATYQGKSEFGSTRERKSAVGNSQSELGRAPKRDILKEGRVMLQPRPHGLETPKGATARSGREGSKSNWKKGL